MALFSVPSARAALQPCRAKHFVVSVAALVAATVAMAAARVDLQWFWLVLFAATTVPFSPWVSSPVDFFRGGLVSDGAAAPARSGFVLFCSAFVSWIFAKGILNTSTLGATFGVVGGLAYSSWFVAFFTVAAVMFTMRTRFGYRSLPEAIHARYGAGAALAFGLAVAYRLEQEVWSNSLVVAGFYGPVGSRAWWLAAVLSTAIPMAYCLTGGMRASLLTDVLQAIVKVALLVAVVSVVGAAAPAAFHSFNRAGTCALPGGAAALASKASCSSVNGQPLAPSGELLCPDKSPAAFKNASCSYATIDSSDVCAAAGGSWAPASCAVSQQPACASVAGASWTPRRMWSLEGGMDLLVVGLLQGGLSYPFFDPVLTDRAFLGDPRIMARAFVLGGVLAILFIFLFSFVGIYGAMAAVLRPDSIPCDLYAGMLAGQPAAVARSFGTAVFSLVNLIFLVSSCSVLDSTFASTSKLCGPELLGALLRGRPLPPQAATQRHAWAGRAAIVLMAVVGTLPLLAGPSALDATTISGTMVVGLGPPVIFLTFLRGYRPLVFHLPFWTGVAFGAVMQLSSSPCCKDSINVSGLTIGGGHYGKLLGFNVASTACCWALGALALLENPRGRELVPAAGGGSEEGEEDGLGGGGGGGAAPALGPFVKDVDAPPAGGAAAAPAVGGGGGGSAV